MKKLLFPLLMVMAINSGAQSKQYRITNVISSRGQETVVVGAEMKSGQLDTLLIKWRGMGRKPSLVGLWVSYHPMGLGKRKYSFVTLNN